MGLKDSPNPAELILAITLTNLLDTIHTYNNNNNVTNERYTHTESNFSDEFFFYYPLLNIKNILF